MESLVEDFIKIFCAKKDFSYQPQATAKRIKQNW
jgi:hypothetical protein